jgi:hypothetical protein
MECAKCGSKKFTVRAVEVGSTDHFYCWMVYCENMHEIVPTPDLYMFGAG